MKIATKIGDRFGRLTILKRKPSRRRRLQVRSRWLCRCDCSAICVKTGGDLRSSHTRSCGCLKVEAPERRVSHGDCRRGNVRPEYSVWSEMIRRCHNRKSASYPRYGARGITVCKRWRKSYRNFIEDLGGRPSDAHTIERINNNKGYSRANVKWATRKEQNRNRRLKRIIRVGGVSRQLCEWAELSGMSTPVIFYRLKRGWSAKDAVTLPVGKQGRRTKVKQ